MEKMMNTQLDDETMEKASGGMFDQDTAAITGIVMVNPYPDDPELRGVWEECEANQYHVYELRDGRIAISYLPPLNVGDVVNVIAIRGAYGWEVDGVIDGPLIH